MNKDLNLHILRIFSILLISSVLSIAGCKDTSSVDRRLYKADSLMEDRPDSSLTILDSIQPSDLHDKNRKARYALLKSMALDKNYVDTTEIRYTSAAVSKAGRCPTDEL